MYECNILFVWPLFYDICVLFKTDNKTKLLQFKPENCSIYNTIKLSNKNNCIECCVGKLFFYDIDILIFVNENLLLSSMQTFKIKTDSERAFIK